MPNLDYRGRHARLLLGVRRGRRDPALRGTHPRRARGRSALVRLVAALGLAAPLALVPAPAHAGPFIDGYLSCVKKTVLLGTEQIRICVKAKIQEQADGLGYYVGNLRVYTYHLQNDAQNCRGVDEIEIDWLKIYGKNLNTGDTVEKWSGPDQFSLDQPNGCYRMFETFHGEPSLPVNFGGLNIEFWGFAKLNSYNDSSWSSNMNITPNNVVCTHDQWCTDPR